MKSKIEELISQAELYQEEGKLKKSLKNYSQAFDILVRLALESARESKDVYIDENGNGGIGEEYQRNIIRFFKSDELACEISHKMGVIFSLLGNDQAAKDMFTQAIDLTPEEVDFFEPYVMLNEIEEKIKEKSEGED